MQSPQVKHSVVQSTPVAVILCFGEGSLLLFSAPAGQSGKKAKKGQSGNKMVNTHNDHHVTILFKNNRHTYPLVCVPTTQQTRLLHVAHHHQITISILFENAHSAVWRGNTQHNTERTQ